MTHAPFRVRTQTATDPLPRFDDWRAYVSESSSTGMRSFAIDGFSQRDTTRRILCESPVVDCTMDAPSKSKKSKSKIKKSGVRTKFMIESLRNDYYALREENDRLRGLVTANLPAAAANQVLSECFDVNAPRAKVDNIDELAEKMAGSGMDDDDDDDE